jgi:hypothetical protein
MLRRAGSWVVRTIFIRVVGISPAIITETLPSLGHDGICVDEMHS